MQGTRSIQLLGKVTEPPNLSASLLRDQHGDRKRSPVLVRGRKHPVPPISPIEYEGRLPKKHELKRLSLKRERRSQENGMSGSVDLDTGQTMTETDWTATRR